jgi:hypothetical protein
MEAAAEEDGVARQPGQPLHPHRSAQCPAAAARSLRCRRRPGAPLARAGPTEYGPPRHSTDCESVFCELDYMASYDVACFDVGPSFPELQRIL